MAAGELTVRHSRRRPNRRERAAIRFEHIHGLDTGSLLQQWHSHIYTTPRVCTGQRDCEMRLGQLTERPSELCFHVARGDRFVPFRDTRALPVADASRAGAQLTSTSAAANRTTYSTQQALEHNQLETLCGIKHTQ